MRSRGSSVSPVSKHHGLLQTLSAGLMEPLLTPETLQHLQIPPTHTNTRAGDEGLTDSFSSLSLRPVALTLRGLHSNSNTAADWSDVGNPSRESPARTVTPASWPTELWRWDLSSERPLSVWKTALGLTLGRQLCGAETAEVFTPHVRLIM